MENRRNHLLRVLGLAFGLAAVVGSIVGQGILRSPGVVAQASDSASVLIALWVLGAILALISAVPFAEMAAAIPSAGGGIAYVERAFGRRAGIVTSIVAVSSMMASTAMLCFVVGEFLVRLGVGGGAIGPGSLAVICLALFCLVNAMGTRASGATQIVLSAAKGAVLIGLVAVLFAQPGTAVSTDPIEIAPAGLAGYGFAILLIVGTYNGWADVVAYSEEIADPGRSIPRAIFGGIAGVAVLYLLVNAALLHILSPQQMAGSELVAADAAGRVFGASGDLLMTLFGVLSVGAIANIGVMTTTRFTFAAARDGILPPVLSVVGARGTPMRAMLASSAISALFLISGTYLALSSIGVSLVQGYYVAVIGAAIALRRSAPDMVRPYRAPMAVVIFPLALVINAVLLGVFVVQDPFYSLLGFVLVAGLSGGYFLLAGTGAAPVVSETAGADPSPSPN